MFTDIVKGSGISCSLIPNLPATFYVNGSNSAAGVLTTIDTVTLPLGAFGVDGDYMDFMYFGTMAGDADTEVFLYLGADAVFDSGIINPANEDFILTGRMIRTGAATQYTASTLRTSTVVKTLLNSTTTAFDQAIGLELKGIGTSESAVSCRAAFRSFYFQNR